MRENAASEPNLKSLFIGSLEFSDHLARKHFLDDQCGDDLQLRAEVERLLAVQETIAVGPLDRVAHWLEPFRLQAQFEDSDLDFEFRIEDTIGPYQLLERIGEGGMGTVYRARQATPVEREVALKLIKPGMDTREVLMRFKSELQTLALMQHPNIASVFDAGMTSQGRPYFVMELVRGLAIDKYCDAAQVSFFTRLQLFVSVCRAIQHAHDKQIVHRDLKPSNVLILAQDGERVVKVIDFGIAKALSAGESSQTCITEFARLVGTPLYMSPEQANHGDNGIDTRSDIFSLGVLLYKLVTGVTPVDRSALQSEGIERIRKLICEEPAQRPSQRLKAIQDGEPRLITWRQISRSQELGKKVRRELDWIILRALEKDPEQRYQSAADFADDIGRFIANEPVHACPPTLLYRTQKAVQKYRWPVGIAAVFTLMLLVTGAISFGLYIRANRVARISQLREQYAYELHESNIFQSALTALSQRDLASMKARLDEYQSLAVPQADRPSDNSHSFATLLRQMADPQPRLLAQHSTAIRDITFSKDATQAFAVDADGQLITASLDGSASFKVLGKHLARTDSIAVSPDGTQAVTGSLTGQVWLWDLATGKVLREFEELDAGVESLVWSADGSLIAAGARYSCFCLYRADGTELFRHANDHRHESILFSQDSKWLYVSTRTGI
ncbi:MAG: protein kinase [Pirellulaceae bacterium]|nr:protein kinase [Pirellulaceae bacterium]